MATDHDFKIKNGAQIENGFLLIGKEALSSSDGYMGMKTSNMTGTSDYMIISGTGDNNTYLSAKDGASVYIRGGGNSSTHQLRISSSSAQFYGNLQIDGNLTVNGTTLTVDTTNLQVQDNNITINYSTGDSSSTANGAGITIQDAVNSSTDATLLWDASSDRFEFSNGVDVENGGTVRVYRSGNSAYGELRFDSGENLDLFNSWNSRYLRLTRDGHLQLSGTTRIAHNGDATLGTISSGDISATGLTVDYTGHRTGDAGILVTNDASDWGIKILKDGTTDYGMLVQTDGANAFMIRNKAGTQQAVISGSTGDATFAGAITTTDGSGSLEISGDNSGNNYFAGSGEFRFRPSGTTINKFVIGSNGNLTTAGTISSGAITTTGDISLNKADGFVYLNNVGTGNSGIYVRGITSSNTLRSHSTNNFRWEVTGSQKMELDSSGNLDIAGNLSLNNNSAKFAAPVYRGSASSVSNAGYTTLFTVTGSALASTIRMTLAGTANSVVVNLTADITVGHYQDILITSRSGFYTTVTLKITSDNNEDFAVEATTNSANAVTLAVEVFPLNNETVTFTSSHSYTGQSHTHTCSYGVATSGTGGNSGDHRTRGRHYISDGSAASPSLAFENDSNTGIYRVGSDSMGWVVGGSRKFYTNTARAYFQNLSEGVDVPSLRISGTTVIDSSRNLTNIGSITASGNLSLDGGRAIFDTDTGSQPFQLNRLGVSTSHNQALRLHVDDSNVVFESQQDETNRYGGYQFNSKHGTTAYTRFQITAGSTSEVLMYDNTGTAKWQWDGNNNRQAINKLTPEYTLDVNGEINANKYRIGGTVVIDNNRNLTSIGTISSGAITSSGTSTFNNFRLGDTSKMGFGTVRASATVGHSSTTEEGIFWHTGVDYGIYRTSGNWSSPNYQQLKLRWATGIELDGGTSYGKSGVNLVNGTAFMMNGTQIIDSSRNLTNIGTVTAGLTKLTPSGYTNSPQGHAALNIGRAGGGETRAIDIWGNWSSGESKSITFNHSTASTQMVGQINVAYQPSSNTSGSSFRWGKLYHGGDSSQYVMELHSESTSYAYLDINRTMVNIGQDSSYGANYGVIGFGGRSNGYNRIFGRTGTADGLFLAAATGRNVFVRANGEGSDRLTLGFDGSYSSYGVVGFGNNPTNGYNRIFAAPNQSDGLYINSATGRPIYFRVNGSGSNAFVMTSGGDFQVGSTTVIDSSRNLTNIGTISSGAITSSAALTADTVLGRNTGMAGEDYLFGITEFDNDTSIRHKFDKEGNTSFTKVTDGTAPAPGVFQVAGYHNVQWGPYIPIDDDTEIVFETWAKYISGGDNTGNFYVGGHFYDENLTSLGNNSRYWGASGQSFDSDSGHSDWKHIKGVLKGSAIRGQTNTSTAKFVRFLVLFNYSAGDNTTRYCGFKFYSSRKTITSLYHKKANHTSAYDVTGFGASYVGGDTNDVIEVINNAGNIRVPGDLLVGTSSTSSGYKLNLSGNMNMNNTHIHYANEVHFNGGTRFKSHNTSTTLHRSSHATASFIALDTNGTIRGYVAGNSDSGHSVGFLDSGGSWAIRHINDQGTEFRTDDSTVHAAIGADLVSGSYGSMVVKDTKNGWSGYSINDRAVFMHNNSTTTGLYNDVNNHWLVRSVHGAGVYLYYNGAEKVQTFASGISIDGVYRTTASAGEYSGNPRSLTVGFSGGNYGQIGYGWVPTTTSGVHTSALSDVQTRIDLHDGIVVYSSNNSVVSSGTNVSWTELLECQSNAFQYKSNNIWHAGNDGSGSGLDADTLDGQQGSYYQSTSGNVRTLNTYMGSSDTSSLQYWQASGQNSNYAPSGDWYNTIRGGHGNPQTYYSNTLAIKMTGSGIGTIYTQTLSNGTFQGWNTYWHNNNDGSGSGLDADTVDGLNVHTGRNNDANKIVRTDGNGYIQAGWINTTSGNHGTTAMDRIYASNDGYIRYYTPANFGSQIAAHVTRLKHYNNFLNLSTSTGSGANLNTTFENDKSGFFDCWSGSNFPPSTSHVQGIQVRHSTGNDYGWQLASQYNQPGKMYLRHVTNGTFYDWHTMWSSQNDGSGSGLDADLLDGYHSGENGASVNLRTGSNGYLYLDNWLRTGNSTGIYTNDGAYFYRGGAYWISRSNSTSISGTRYETHGGTIRGYVYSDNSNQIGFLNETGNWRLKVQSAGSTYLGGTQQVRINSSSTTAIVEGSSTNLVIRNTGGGSIQFQKSGGTATANISNSGNFVALGNVTAYGSPSDIKLKENIETISNAVEKVQKLDGVTFNYKKDGGRSTGLIAQQLQEVLPEVVYTAEDLDGEEHLAVRYGNTVGLLVEAIKELKEEINELKAQLKEK